MAAIVVIGESASFRSLSPAPEVDADLLVWFLANLDRTVSSLRDTDAQQKAWTFSSLGDHRVSWWRRRLAVEAAIHRWDAQYAVAVQGGAAPTPLDADVAAVGIEEFVTEFLPGLLDQSAGRPSGEVHLLHADAEPHRWLDLDEFGNDVPSDVLLRLTNRRADSVDVRGDRDLLGAWTRLKR